MDLRSGTSSRKLFVTPAQQAINLRLVYSTDDVLSPNTNYFKPLFAHQIFGQNEMIFGYRNLHIDIYFTAVSALCYVDLKHTEVIQEDSARGVKPDDIFAKLRPWLPKNFCTDKQTFLELIRYEKKNITYGSTTTNFRIQDSTNTTRSYKINIMTNDNPEFLAFHERFQTFIIFFIDAANYIDLSDPKWMFFYLYEEKRVGRNRMVHYPIGFCTVYQFFAYPDMIRPRISQFFILPPFQRMGLGSKLLQAVYNHILEMPNVLEITVESPNAHFSKLRDIYDTRALITLPIFRATRLLYGFTKTMAVTANKTLKLNRNQALRVYHILLLYYTEGRPAFRHFQKQVKLTIRRNYKKEYQTAVQENKTHKVESLRAILDADMMAEPMIETKYKQFYRAIKPVVDYVHLHK